MKYCSENAAIYLVLIELFLIISENFKKISNVLQKRYVTIERAGVLLISNRLGTTKRRIISILALSTWKIVRRNSIDV